MTLVGWWPGSCVTMTVCCAIDAELRRTRIHSDRLAPDRLAWSFQSASSSGVMRSLSVAVFMWVHYLLVGTESIAICGYNWALEALSFATVDASSLASRDAFWLSSWLCNSLKRTSARLIQTYRISAPHWLSVTISITCAPLPYPLAQTQAG